MLRELANGSYGGWNPRAEDLYRLQTEAVTYVDRNGFACPSEGPNTRTGTKIVDPLAQMEQLNTEYNGTRGIEPTHSNGFSPINFFAGSAGFPFGIPSSTPTKNDESGQPPAPSMEFMLYNDFMMDVGSSARFFEEDLLNSIFFPSTPLPLATEDTRLVHNMEFQENNIASG